MAANALFRAELYDTSLRHLHRLTALHEIDRAITGSFDLRVVLNVFLEQVVNQLHVDAADVLLLDPHTLDLEHAASRGFRSLTPDRTVLRLSASQAGHVVFQRRAREIPNIAHLGKIWVRQRLLHEENFVYAYLVPLVAKGEVQGVLELFHRSPLEPEEEWKDFANTLATQSAIAIENAKLFTDLQRSNTQLMQAYDATIEGWSRALDLRDEETEGHSMRVTQLTLRLAREMGITQKEIIHIRRGALLHDIGKMGVPDSILLKPGKLSNEEWEVMKTHPILAYEMLAPIQFLRPALDIPYSHHERWDGSGYPRGLRGEQIPQAARLFAVVDVYDALTSNRPYRPAWSREKTIAYLKEQTGTQFDPRVVEAFLRILAEDSPP